jgi:hypothetical protein
LRFRRSRIEPKTEYIISMSKGGVEILVIQARSRPVPSGERKPGPLTVSVPLA